MPSLHYYVLMRNVIPTTIYFTTEQEKADAEAKAKARDMSLSALIRSVLRKLPKKP